MKGIERIENRNPDPLRESWKFPPKNISTSPTLISSTGYYIGRNGRRYATSEGLRLIIEHFMKRMSPERLPSVK